MVKQKPAANTAMRAMFLMPEDGKSDITMALLVSITKMNFSNTKATVMPPLTQS
jgi:hypothetical protein